MAFRTNGECGDFLCRGAPALQDAVQSCTVKTIYMNKDALPTNQCIVSMWKERSQYDNMMILISLIIKGHYIKVRIDAVESKILG